MDPERLSTLLSLEPEDRYWYTVDRAARTGLLWRLEGEGGGLISIAPEGYDYLPIWPDKALAQLAADLSFPGYSPKELPLETFRAEWIDDLEGAGVRIGVFPDADATFWEVGALTFHDAIDDATQSQI